jgi:phospholipid-binding lipoprotein MlaA
MKERMLSNLSRCVAVLALLALSACSTVRSPSPADPFEGFNRSVDTFNQQLDTYALRPTARAYVAVVPEFARMGVSNFFGNIGDVLIGINNLLQGKPVAAASDFGRFFVNTTIGVVGLFDVATDMGLKKNNEDFGQTLGRWGVGSGPYLVLPVFGPSSVRDAVGFVVDIQADPVVSIDSVATRNAVGGLRVVNRRADLLELTDSVEGVALDSYSFVRDAYLANRRNRVYDGDPPAEKFIDETGENDPPK